MKKTDQFTIIIPAHNRPRHLKRLLEYYLSYDIRIIVADSSRTEFCYLKEYEQKIVYRHYPNVCLAEKISFILALIETPYVLMCADDDFILPESICLIIEFLKSHLDYNSGQGIYADFDPYSSLSQLHLRYSHMLNLQIDADNGIDRILHLMGNYFQYYYCVYRTSAFKATYSTIIVNGKAEIVNLCLLECFVSSYPAISGKHVILPVLYGIRENAVCSAATITDCIPKVISNPVYGREYSAYIRILAAELEHVDRISSHEANQIIRESVALYVHQNYPTYNSFYNRIRRRAKIFLRQPILLKWQNLLSKKQIDSHRCLKEIPAHIEMQKEWGIVREYILKYYDICYK